MEVVSGIIAGAVGFAFYRASASATSLRRLPPRPGRGTCQKHDGKSAIVVPMRADENSIFLVDVGVEDEKGVVQWVKVAVDTGSESLMIASSDCAGCEEGRHLGTIKNDGTVIRRSVVRYGSQKDSVDWKSKNVRLPSWAQTCDPWDSDGALTDAVQCVLGSVPVGVVQERTGSSDYNILGLGSQTSGGPPAVMHALFPGAKVRAFQIEVHSAREARLILHKPADRCRPPRFRFAVRPKYLGHGHHYLVNVSALSLYGPGPIGGGEPGTPIDGNFHVLFDTGANALSLPPAVYDKVHSMQSSYGKLSMTLKSKDDKDVVLNFDYNRRNNQNAQVLRGRSNSMIIVGVTFLIGHALGFEDHGSHRILTLDFL